MKILGLGVPELLIILAVALLIFGPKHLPKLGRSLGRTIHNFREGLGNDKDEEAPKRKKKAAAKKLEAPADEAPVKEAKAEEPATDVAETVASEPANAQ